MFLKLLAHGQMQFGLGFPECLLNSKKITMQYTPTQGPKLDAVSLNQVLTHIFQRNDEVASHGRRGTPVCI
jgi:hypothetical protein